MVWRMLIDFKYNTSNRNIFTCRSSDASNFWSGALWAANVARMGYRWRVGNEINVRFWKMFGLKILALLFNIGSYIVL
jgi:hypothetical protein